MSTSAFWVPLFALVVPLSILGGPDLRGPTVWLVVVYLVTGVQVLSDCATEEKGVLGNYSHHRPASEEHHSGSQVLLHY